VLPLFQMFYDTASLSTRCREQLLDGASLPNQVGIHPTTLYWRTSRPCLIQRAGLGANFLKGYSPTCALDSWICSGSQGASFAKASAQFGSLTPNRFLWLHCHRGPPATREHGCSHREDMRRSFSGCRLLAAEGLLGCIGADL
jgi:hypothetical protein